MLSDASWLGLSVFLVILAEGGESIDCKRLDECPRLHGNFLQWPSTL